MMIGLSDPTEVTPLSYRGHVGEYNGTWAEPGYAYFAWTDYRLSAVGSIYARNQSDIRFVKITWP